MLLTVGVCVILLAIFGAAESDDGGNTARDYFDSGGDSRGLWLNGYADGNRLKRSLAALGAAAVKFLLNGARHIYSTTRERVFMKSGGYVRAFEDFKALDPTNVKVVRIKGEMIRHGDIGDGKVFIARGGRDNQPAVVIQQQNGQSRRTVFVVYTN